MVCIILDSPKRDNAERDVEPEPPKMEQDLTVQRIAGGSVIEYAPIFSAPSGESVLFDLF